MIIILLYWPYLNSTILYRCKLKLFSRRSRLKIESDVWSNERNHFCNYSFMSRGYVVSISSHQFENELQII